MLWHSSFLIDFEFFAILRYNASAFNFEGIICDGPIWEANRENIHGVAISHRLNFALILLSHQKYVILSLFNIVWFKSISFLTFLLRGRAKWFRQIITILDSRVKLGISRRTLFKVDNRAAIIIFRVSYRAEKATFTSSRIWRALQVVGQWKPGFIWISTTFVWRLI